MEDLIKEQIAHEMTKQHMYLCQLQALQLMQEKSQSVVAHLNAKLESKDEQLSVAG